MNLTATPAYLLNFADNQALKQVLPFWSSRVLNPAGGLFGEVDNTGTAVADAEHGSIMYARCLWSFALAYEQTGDPAFLLNAQHVYEAICEHFLDPERGGVFFLLDSNFQPVDDSKILIAQAYTLYAFSKFYQVHADSQILAQIDELVEMIETHFLRDDGTYLNGLARDFSDNDPKQQLQTETCNQLHLLEALSQHYSVCPSPELKHSLTGLVDLFLQRIFPGNEDHLQLIFTRDWQKTGLEISFGHNLEAPFLVHYACVVLGDEQRRSACQQQLIRLVDLTLAQCRDAAGNYLYGIDKAGKPYQTLSWWPQTEASNALLLSYELTGEEKYLQELKKLWQNIRQYWVDNEYGEWHTDLTIENLQPAGNQHKAGPWRCNYHTTRACFAVSRGTYALKKNEPESSVA